MAKALASIVSSRSINLQPLAAGRRNFGVLLIVGASGESLWRNASGYTGIDGVAADFGVSTPEYKAAGPNPRAPRSSRIGRWAKTAPAVLRARSL